MTVVQPPRPSPYAPGTVRGIGVGAATPVLDGLGAAIWNTLLAGNALGLCPGEVAFTDLALLHLARESWQVVTRKHTGPEEGGTVRRAKAGGPAASARRGTGADWEWWVGGPRGWVGFRVQAKVLAPDTLRYKALRKSPSAVRPGVEQLDDLIDGCLGASYPVHPLLAFYNGWDTSVPNAFGTPSRRGSMCSATLGTPALHGWTALDAYEAWYRLYTAVLFPGGDPADHLSRYVRPAHPVGCLFAPPGWGCADMRIAERSAAARATPGTVARGSDSWANAVAARVCTTTVTRRWHARAPRRLDTLEAFARLLTLGAPPPGSDGRALERRSGGWRRLRRLGRRMEGLLGQQDADDARGPNPGEAPPGPRVVRALPAHADAVLAGEPVADEVWPKGVAGVTVLSSTRQERHARRRPQ